MIDTIGGLMLILSGSPDEPEFILPYRTRNDTHLPAVPYPHLSTPVTRALTKPLGAIRREEAGVCLATGKDYRCCSLADLGDLSSRSDGLLFHLHL